MSEIVKVKSWDALPPVVQGQGELFSTRILERKYRKMEDALRAIANNGLDAKQCRELALETIKDLS